MASRRSHGVPERVPGKEVGANLGSIPHIRYRPRPVNPELEGVKEPW